MRVADRDVVDDESERGVAAPAARAAESAFAADSEGFMRRPAAAADLAVQEASASDDESSEEDEAVFRTAPRAVAPVLPRGAARVIVDDVFFPLPRRPASARCVEDDDVDGSEVRSSAVARWVRLP